MNHTHTEREQSIKQIKAIMKRLLKKWTKKV